MGAYAATVTLTDQATPKNLLNGWGLVKGTVDITNYNQTLAEITAITGRFRGGAPTVILGGLTDNGFLVAWDATAKAVKAWYPTAASDQTPTADIVAAAATQVASDVDVGAVEFLAIGVMTF